MLLLQFCKEQVSSVLLRQRSCCDLLPYWYSESRTVCRQAELLDICSYYICRNSVYCVRNSLTVTRRCTVGDTASTIKFGKCQIAEGGNVGQYPTSPAACQLVFLLASLSLKFSILRRCKHCHCWRVHLCWHTVQTQTLCESSGVWLNNTLFGIFVL